MSPYEISGVESVSDTQRDLSTIGVAEGPEVALAGLVRRSSSRARSTTASARATSARAPATCLSEVELRQRRPRARVELLHLDGTTRERTARRDVDLQTAVVELRQRDRRPHADEQSSGSCWLPVRASYDVAIPGFATYDQAPSVPVLTCATCMKPDDVNERAKMLDRDAGLVVRDGARQMERSCRT